MTRLLSPSHNLLQHEPSDTGESALYRRLKRLPRRARQVFLYSRLDELPYAAIARRMGIDVTSVQKDMALVLDQCRPASLRGEPQVLQQAGDWYVKLQCPQTTPSERIDFRRWLDADSTHLRAFHDTELVWRQLLGPARALGAGQWYRRHWLRPSLRGWIAALLTGVLLWELGSWL